VAPALAALAAAGCAVGSGGTAVARPPRAASPAPAASARPAPTRTVIRSGHTYDAGTTATFTAQAGVSARFSVSTARLSRTRLSSSYGYPPAHGYYVTFTVTVTNTGRDAFPIGPQYFVTQARGRTTTSYDGNAPYSGASSQLDNTAIDPGQSDSGPLTFDVSTPHGVLDYEPDGSPALSWRY
jgi:hypothetical protein